MNRKTLQKALSVLKVDVGDLLLVQTDDIDMSNQIASAIADLRNKMGLSKCLVVVLGKGDKLERIDPKAMERMGWIRAK